MSKEQLKELIADLDTDNPAELRRIAYGLRDIAVEAMNHCAELEDALRARANEFDAAKDGWLAEITQRNELVVDNRRLRSELEDVDCILDQAGAPEMARKDPRVRWLSNRAKKAARDFAREQEEYRHCNWVSQARLEENRRLQAENTQLRAGMEKVHSTYRACSGALGGRPSDAQSVVRLVCDDLSEALSIAGMEPAQEIAPPAQCPCDGCTMNEGYEEECQGQAMASKLDCSYGFLRWLASLTKCKACGDLHLPMATGDGGLRCPECKRAAMPIEWIKENAQ